GKTIIISHGSNYTTLYGHLSAYAIQPGDWVNLVQTIGYIGRTGRATGPHLHFEVRCHNLPQNPIAYLGRSNKSVAVRFRRRRRVRGSYLPQRRLAKTTHRKSVKRGPNYYTRMINLQKLRKMKKKVH
ncbi:MAG: M23 family metallopeptidase, partial [Bdellovibrionales bacterium]|nr:M23 family metallopeptidase [Bdellovibrionales bacterium]